MDSMLNNHKYKSWRMNAVSSDGKSCGHTFKNTCLVLVHIYVHKYGDNIQTPMHMKKEEHCRDQPFSFGRWMQKNGALCSILHSMNKWYMIEYSVYCYRWAGIAKGVGVQRIIGRIHMVQMRIEKDFLTTSFSVLEEQPMDMLLGLDMLKRHQVFYYS